MYEECTVADRNVWSELTYNRADSRLVPSQWETSLQSNAVSHWLGANQEPALYKVILFDMEN